MNLGSQGVDISNVVDIQDQVATRPGINEIEPSINNFPNTLPQVITSARPIGPELPPAQLTPVDKVPSIADLPTTSTRSSPFLNNPTGFIPDTSIGNIHKCYLP